MPRRLILSSKDCCLRFVFHDEVVSFDLDDGATFGDIALRLDELTIRQFGRPVAIDIVLATSSRVVRPPAHLLH